MTHETTPEFWELYYKLPISVQRTADKNYELLKADSYYPSLHFKEVKPDLWSVRAGKGYRALVHLNNQECVWFWIGSHANYDQLIK